MNKTLSTLAVAALAVGLCGAVSADDKSDNKVYSTSGADSRTTHDARSGDKFNQLDSNKDGKLSKSELESAGRDGKYADKWSTMDTNQDGSIDESEFNRFKASHKDKQGHKDNQGTRSMHNDSGTTNQQGTQMDRNRANQQGTDVDRTGTDQR